MYKIFKAKYLILEGNSSLIQIANCDSSARNNLVYEGYYILNPNENVDIYSNSINCKDFNISEGEPLSYKEVADLIDLLIEDSAKFTITYSEKSLKDRLYKALLFYDDYMDYKLGE